MRLIRLILITVVLLFASTAWGQSCSVSAVGVSFGQYISGGNPLDAEGSVDVTCDADTTVTVKLNPGVNSGGSFFPRKMASGSDTLDYNLYIDSARTQIWGDGTNTTFVGTFSSADSPFVVYGRIPEAQNVPAGSYGDTVTVTVEW